MSLYVVCLTVWQNLLNRGEVRRLQRQLRSFLTWSLLYWKYRRGRDFSESVMDNPTVSFSQDMRRLAALRQVACSGRFRNELLMLKLRLTRPASAAASNCWIERRTNKESLNSSLDGNSRVLCGVADSGEWWAGRTCRWCGRRNWARGRVEDVRTTPHFPRSEGG